jgi:hypothetical protein
VKRLLIVVEGQTEEAFVKHTLGPHLAPREIFSTPIVVTTKRDRLTGKKTGRGGGFWKNWKKDIRRLFLDSDPTTRFTTLFDLYGLPEDFPSVPDLPMPPDHATHVSRLESAMARDVGGDQRFIPYLQRHEFEALVLAGLKNLERLLDASDDLAGLEALRAELGSTPPEDVNDGEETAPSKRLLRHIPSYQKTVHGPLVVEQAGVASLRALCPRFDGWVSTLESL